VLIGGFAVILHGYERLTQDLDVCYERSRENIRRLVALLRELHAYPREWPPGLPFILDEQSILNGDSFTLSTDLGPLALLATPDGPRGFPDLATHRETYEVGDKLLVDVASIDDLIRMKRASSTQSMRARKDLDDIEALEAIRAAKRDSSMQ